MNESEKDHKYFVIFRRQSAIWWNWQRKEGPGKPMQLCTDIHVCVYFKCSEIIQSKSLPVVGLVIDYR